MALDHRWQPYAGRTSRISVVIFWALEGQMVWLLWRSGATLWGTKETCTEQQRFCSC